MELLKLQEKSEESEDASQVEAFTAEADSWGKLSVWAGLGGTVASRVGDGQVKSTKRASSSSNGDKNVRHLLC